MKNLLSFLIACMLFSACESRNNNGPVPGYDINKLEGTWELDSISATTIPFAELYPSAKPFIKFDVAAKRVSGKTSCNSFSGALITKDSTISFTGPIAMTKMYCQGEGEPVFTRALALVGTYTITGNSLIFLSEGKMIMRFIKKA